MILDKLKSDFFAANHREQAVLMRQRNIDRLDRTIAMGQRVLALRGAGGYQEFTKAVEDMRDHLRQSMENHRGDDSEMRMLQGQVQGITMVLRLLQSTENSLDSLAQKRKQEQDELEHLVNPGPQPT